MGAGIASATNQLRDSRAGAEAHKLKARSEGNTGGRVWCDDRPRCYACGRHGHFACSPQCPARGRTCTKCGKTGHFAPVSRTNKRLPGGGANASPCCVDDVDGVSGEQSFEKFDGERE